jgi:DNA polymerase III delta subunit
MGVISYQQGIKSLNTKNVFIISGDENFLKDQIKNKIILENKECDLIKLDADEFPEDKIIEDLNSKDLFSSKKIFIIKNFNKIKNIEYFLNKKFSDILILDLSKKPKSKKFNELENKYDLIDCLKPKPWEQEEDCVNKIKNILNKSGLSISNEDASFIYSNIGYDLYKITREIHKIIIYKQNDISKKVSHQDIINICTLDLNYNIFDIIDKILNREKKESLTLMNRLFRNDSNSSILLINLWCTHFENLLLCKKNRKNTNDLFKYINLPPMIVKNKILPQANKITTKKIVESLDYLANLDLNLRKGTFNLKFYLEKFIINF